jgi:hypothetical protein
VDRSQKRTRARHSKTPENPPLTIKKAPAGDGKRLCPKGRRHVGA